MFCTLCQIDPGSISFQLIAAAYNSLQVVSALSNSFLILVCTNSEIQKITYILSFAYHAVLVTVLILHITGPLNQLSEMGKVKKKGHIYIRSTNFHNFAPIMIESEEHFANLETLKCLFRHFFQNSLQLLLRNTSIKKTRKKN